MIKLDYSLQTPEERNQLVEKILEENPNPSEAYLEVLADYLVLCMEKQERKERKLLTDNRMATVTKRETSFEGLVSQLENGEDGIYNLMTENKMKEWLGVISTDYEAYGGYTKASVDPEPVNPDEVADPIEGVSDYEGMGSSDGMVRMFTCNNENYKKLGELVGSGWMTGNIGDAIISNKIIRFTDL